MRPLTLEAAAAQGLVVRTQPERRRLRGRKRERPYLIVPHALWRVRKACLRRNASPFRASIPNHTAKRAVAPTRSGDTRLSWER